MSNITQSIATDGPAVTAFKVQNPDLWPEGKYKLEISLDGWMVADQDFKTAKKLASGATFSLVKRRLAGRLSVHKKTGNGERGTCAVDHASRGFIPPYVWTGQPPRHGRRDAARGTNKAANRDGKKKWCARRESNPRPPPSEGGTLSS